MKTLTTFLLLLTSQWVSAFVHQRTVDGESFVWSGAGSDTVSVYVNGSNSSGIDSSTIYERTMEAAAEWNQAGGPVISVQQTYTSEKEQRNDVYFTSNTSYFSGSSILAVTSSAYNATTGKIIEADIIIKDSVLFTDDEDESPYIGDLITHELGHLVGLDHSTMPFSTMFYQLVRGQNTLSFDDLLGKRTLYDSSRDSGIISGYVAGSDNIISIFAADVKLISSKSGEVIASTLSEEDGYFEFDGVPLDDVYYIFVSPFKALDTVSEYYQTVETDFCTSYNDFRGGFYQSCGNSRKGYPLGIQLDSSTPTVDAGTVSIQCDLDVPTNYLSQRNVGSFELDTDSDKLGDSFVGYFSELSVENGYYDEITIDLSDFDSSAGGFHLDLRLISQELYSRVGFQIDVESDAGDETLTSSVSDDNTPVLNLNGRIELSTDPDENVFTVRVTPQDFDDLLADSDFDSESLYFPDFETFGDDKMFYQFIYYVSQEAGGEYEIYQHYDYPVPTGNERCMEGEETYSVKASGSVTGTTTELSRSTTDTGILACGTIAMMDDQDPPDGQGPLTILVGFCLAFSLGVIQRRQNSF